MKNALLLCSTLALFLLACKKKGDPPSLYQPVVEAFFIRGADVSSLPMVEDAGIKFQNSQASEIDFLKELKANGVNTVRIQLLVDPANGRSGIDEVTTLSQRAKMLGFKTWIGIHYSDTRADQAQQLTPARWSSLDFVELKDSIYSYTAKSMRALKPDYVQLGNEINPGMLFPEGSVTNPEKLIELLQAGADAVRDESSNTKIILHYAGLTGADRFYAQFEDLDYDIIGLSYYPIWHGKDLDRLRQALSTLTSENERDIVLAETAYPHTLDNSDETANVINDESQLILPDLPASAVGQRAYVDSIRGIMTDADRGIGFCYWGGEIVAFDGTESTNGSHWENQAFFNANFRSLRVLNAFKE